MKKVLFLILVLLMSATCMANEVKEKKPLPTIMYMGEELNLEDYFDITDVLKIEVKTNPDKKLVSTLLYTFNSEVIDENENVEATKNSEENITNEETKESPFDSVNKDEKTTAENEEAENTDNNIADPGIEKTVADVTTIVDIISGTSLKANKMGTTNIDLIFYFQNNQTDPVIKNYKLSVVDYDAKELKALMGRHDSQKSTIIKVIVIVVVVLVVLYLLSILSKYKMKKKRMAQKMESQEGSVRRQRVLQTSNVPDYSRKRPKVNYENDDFDFRNFRNRKY